MAQIQIDPEIEKRPILPPKEDYEGVLENVDVRPARWDNTKQVFHAECVIKHPEFGFVRVFQDFDMSQGSRVPRLLAQLGIDRDQQKAGFDTEDLHGRKVVADIGVRSYNRSGEEVVTNTIRNLHQVLG